MWSSRKKLCLNQVTLVAVTSVKLEETAAAMQYSMKSIAFGDAVFISHQRPECLLPDIRYIEVAPMNSINAYNHMILFELYQYIQTKYVLIVHWDGFVVNPFRWQDDFLKYDYIGAPWPKELDFRDTAGNLCRVGNGVSLRSKRLLEFPTQMKLEWDHENEDTYLCCRNKLLLEQEGIRIAPLEVAKYFSHERMIPEIRGIKPFMFHNWGGDNAQYPEIGSSKWVKCKKQIIKLLVRIGVWYPYQMKKQ